MNKRIDWIVVIGLAVIHLIVILFAWVTYTPEALIVGFLLFIITGLIGVCVGYHRYLTHKSFKTYRWVKILLALLGGLSGEGSAIFWVAMHRKHHKFSDKEGDPHSPLEGFWWSHMLWMMKKNPEERIAEVACHARHLATDKALWFLHKTFALWHLVLAALLFGGGYLLGDWPMAWSFLVWGMFVRMIAVLHATWFVNSATHLWGYRNYETDDNSRNNWWVALLTGGEGWHNNHHAHEEYAKHGHKWWELDPTYWIICLMRLCHLAWEVQPTKEK